MSLLDAFMTDFVKMDKKSIPDGGGGFYNEWEEGAHFMCAMILDQSIQAKIAEKEGVTSLYTATVSRSVPLEFHDAIKRVSDGQIFRLTSHVGEKDTPYTASLDMRQFSAERWTLA